MNLDQGDGKPFELSVPDGGGGDIAQCRTLVETVLARSGAERDRTALEEALGRLSRLADREAAIDAMHRTAADIVRARQVNHVLEAAVQRTHCLIGSDLAYLSLYDEETRETWVKTSVGARHASFDHLRVPFGSGVGGMVARLKGPFFTPDYLADERFGHLQRVDRGIAAEGIRAMLGVPLIVDDQFTGALFVADRRVRSYTREEIEHLMGLGSLVALAIDGARLLEEREKGLRDIRSAYDALRARNAATERVAALHDQISGILAREGTIQDLLRGISDSMAIEVKLIGPTRSVSEGVGEIDVDRLAPALHEVLALSRRGGRCAEVNADDADGERWVLALPGGAEPLGHLDIRSPRPLLGTDRRMLERAGHVAALLLLNERDRLLRNNEDRGRLLSLLLSEYRNLETVGRLGKVVGIDPQAAAFVLRIDSGEEVSPRVIAEVAAVVAPLGGCACARDEKLFALLPHEEVDRLAPVHRAIGDALGRPPTIGFALCGDLLRDGSRAAKDAAGCCDLLLSFGRHGEMADWRRFGSVSLLLGGNSRPTLAAFMDQALGPVIQYDANQKTSLAATLRAYLDAGQNATQAAMALKIHPKTMLQRLDRLERLLGHDWLNAENVLNLQFALRLRDWLSEALCAKSV